MAYGYKIKATSPRTDASPGGFKKYRVSIEAHCCGISQTKVISVHAETRHKAEIYAITDAEGMLDALEHKSGVFPEDGP